MSTQTRSRRRHRLEPDLPDADRVAQKRMTPGPIEHSPGGPRLTAKGKATRQRIISAASEAFSERGVTASSNDVILAVAGASHSQLYHYFPSRDDLVAAVIADRVEQVLRHQESLLADLDSIEGLRLWRDATIAPQEDCEGRHGCPIGSLVGELSERDPRSRQASPPPSNGGTRRSAAHSANARVGRDQHGSGSRQPCVRHSRGTRRRTVAHSDHTEHKAPGTRTRLHD